MKIGVLGLHRKHNQDAKQNKQKACQNEGQTSFWVKRLTQTITKNKTRKKHEREWLGAAGPP